MTGNFKKAYWPELSTASDAEKAVKAAAFVAFFVAALTGLASVLTLLSVTRILPGWAIFDALVFGVLGLLILRGSRVAAVLGLILYVIQLVAAIVATGNPAGLIVGLFFTSAFITGVRGTYLLKRLRGSAEDAAPAAQSGA
jgi:hypothetical protein